MATRSSSCWGADQMATVSASTLEKFKKYVDGRWVDAVAGDTFRSLDPFSGEDWG
jgi:hypothetical protein